MEEFFPPQQKMFLFLKMWKYKPSDIICVNYFNICNNYYQEVACGQYLGSGGLTMIGQLVPILQGVGYATMTIVFWLGNPFINN